MWSISKSLHIPLDPNIKLLTDIPYTISFVIRKRQQIDSLSELPEEKRPPERLIWEGTADDISDWIDKVFDREKPKFDGLLITDEDIER